MRRLPDRRVATVIAVSPLLRELILTVCGEPVVWDARGPVRLVAALALHEIRRAGPGRCPCRPAVIRAWHVSPRSFSPIASDQRDLAEFAALAGASVRTLARLFRAETGMSFQQWRRQLRMTEALSRIAQGVPLARVAASVGYASLPAFSAAFRETFGTTPSEAAPRG